MAVFIQHHATVKWGSRHILRIKMTVTINTMLNLDGDFDIHEYSDVTCKHTFRHDLFLCPSVNLVGYYCLWLSFHLSGCLFPISFPKYSQSNQYNSEYSYFSFSVFSLLICTSMYFSFCQQSFCACRADSSAPCFVCVFSFSTFFPRIFLLCTPIQ